MRVEELCAKLRPIYGSKIERLWYAYLAAKPNEKRLLEVRLNRLHEKRIGIAQDVLLEPPSLQQADGEYVLGKVCYADKELYHFGLREGEWIQHLSIFGRSGSGKTNLVLIILWNFIRHQKPFLVFDWKRNYRDFLSFRGTEELQLFTVGRDLLPFRFNPWIPPPGITPKIWLKKVIEVLCHAYFAGEGVMDVLIRSVDQAYQDKETPLSEDVFRHAERIRERSREAQWKASALRIMRSLTYGGMGEVTRTEDNSPVQSLLNSQVILELDALADSDKTFLIEALLLWIHHYRLSIRRREKFEHAIVIEEAHHILLRKKQEFMGEAITDVILREIREFGESIVIVDQHPGLISLPAIGNSYSTISFNLKHQLDVNTAAGSMLLEREERNYLGYLETGQAIAKLQGRYLKPFQIAVPRVKMEKGKVTDQQLQSNTVARRARMQLEGLDYELCQIPGAKHQIKVPSVRGTCFLNGNKGQNKENNLTETSQQPQNKPLEDGNTPLTMMGTTRPCSACSGADLPVLSDSEEVRTVPRDDKQEQLSQRERVFLESVGEEPLLSIRERYRRLGLSSHQGNTIQKELVGMGFLSPVPMITSRGRIVLLEPTKKAEQFIPPRTSLRKGGLEHQYWCTEAKRKLLEAGFELLKTNSSTNGYFPDLLAEREGTTIIVEIETGKSDFALNLQRALELNPNQVYVLATSLGALEKIRSALSPPHRVVVMLAKDFRL